jgi:hypothetical protein
VPCRSRAVYAADVSVRCREHACLFQLCSAAWRSSNVDVAAASRHTVRVASSLRLYRRQKTRALSHWLGRVVQELGGLREDALTRRRAG